MKNILAWIKSFFINSFKELWNAAFPVIKQELIGAIKDIAMQAVIEAKDTGLSNEQKRAEVFAKIKEYASKRGIAVKDHIIDLAISMCVSAVKGA